LITNFCDGFISSTCFHSSCLVHLSDKGVNAFLAETSITSFEEVDALLGVATKRSAELEWPQEVVRLLEVRTAGDNFVDEIFNANDAVLAQALLNNLVVVKGDTILVHFAETSLVDQLANGLDGGLTIGNVVLDHLKHDEGRFVHFQKHTVVDLAETQELKNLGGLWGHTVNTANADHEENLGFSRLVEAAEVLGLTLAQNEVFLSRTVLFHITFGALEDLFAGDFLGLGSRGLSSGALCLDLLKGSALFKGGFGNSDSLIEKPND